MHKRIIAAAVAGLFGVSAIAFAGEFQGPSSSATPYYLSVGTADITSLLTVGDSVRPMPNGVDPYRMVGIPDGLGAFDNGDGTFTLLMNHEIGATAGSRVPMAPPARSSRSGSSARATSRSCTAAT